MQATGDDATKPQATPEADELARDLPGLPFETKHLRADERGVLVKKWLFRHEQLIPWGETVGYKCRPLEIILERQGADECEVHLVRAWAGRATRRVIDSAWREYVLRKIERDGVLRGTHSLSRIDESGACGIVVGMMFGGISVLMLLASARQGTQPGLRSFAIVLLLVSAGLIFAGIRERRLQRKTLLNWYKWEFLRKGIAYWSGEERVLLDPSSSHAIGSGLSRV